MKLIDRDRLEEQKRALFSEYFELQGYCSAIVDYGIWNNGKQTIGCLQKPVDDIRDEIEEKQEKISIKLNKIDQELESDTTRNPRTEN